MWEIGELDDCCKSSYPPAAVCTYTYIWLMVGQCQN